MSLLTSLDMKHLQLEHYINVHFSKVRPGYLYAQVCIVNRIWPQYSLPTSLKIKIYKAHQQNKGTGKCYVKTFQDSIAYLIRATLGPIAVICLLQNQLSKPLNLEKSSKLFLSIKVSVSSLWRVQVIKFLMFLFTIKNIRGQFRSCTKEKAQILIQVFKRTPDSKMKGTAFVGPELSQPPALPASTGM